jgi:hypothetical protein
MLGESGTGKRKMSGEDEGLRKGARGRGRGGGFQHSLQQTTSTSRWIKNITRKGSSIVDQ